jgi:hypothetical protein
MPQIAAFGLRIGTCVIATLVLVTPVAELTFAEAGQLAAKPRPGWLPPYAAVSNFSDDFSAAEKTEAMRVFAEIERILMQVPELASPKGFEVKPRWGGSRPWTGPNTPPDPTHVFQYDYTLFFFAPTQAIAGEGCTCLTVSVNFRSVWGLLGALTTTLEGDKGEPIYYEPTRGDRVPLSTEVYGRLPPGEPRAMVTVLTSGGDPFFRVVTREEYYNAYLRNLEGKDGVSVAEVRKASEKTPYQEWLQGAAERRKEREEALKAAAGLPAAEVAKLRKALEDTEREIGERLKASENADRAERTEGMKQFLASTNAIRAELKSMTPAERRLPAIYDEAGSGHLNATDTSMVDKDGPGMRRILTPIPDFWRARKSNVEIRGIAVYIGATGTGLVPAVNNALVQASKKLDWAAFNKLLAVPRSK